MKIQTLTDIDKLPSVLDIDDLNVLLLELVEVIRKENISPLKGAETINDLISYCGYTKEEFSEKCSLSVLAWTEETYDGDNQSLVEWHAANMANMRRKVAVPFFEKRLSLAKNDFERQELNECLQEIGART